MIVGAVVGVTIIAGVALWNYHEQPQFCATCHVMQPYLESWESSSFLVRAHAEEEIACLDCHVPTIQQQVDELIKNVKKDYENPLKVRKFPKEWCFQCHEHGSYEELVQFTKDYIVDGEKVNPHDTHLGQEECYRCHRMHKQSLGINYCYSCHHERTLANDCLNLGCHGQ